MPHKILVSPSLLAMPLCKRSLLYSDTGCLFTIDVYMNCEPVNKQMSTIIFIIMLSAHFVCITLSLTHYTYLGTSFYISFKSTWWCNLYFKGGEQVCNCQIFETDKRYKWNRYPNTDFICPCCQYVVITTYWKHGHIKQVLKAYVACSTLQNIIIGPSWCEGLGFTVVTKPDSERGSHTPFNQTLSFFLGTYLL